MDEGQGELPASRRASPPWVDRSQWAVRSPPAGRGSVVDLLREQGEGCRLDDVPSRSSRLELSQFGPLAVRSFWESFALSKPTERLTSFTATHLPEAGSYLRIVRLEWGLQLRTGGFDRTLLPRARVVLDEDLLQPRSGDDNRCSPRPNPRSGIPGGRRPMWRCHHPTGRTQ